MIRHPLLLSIGAIASVGAIAALVVIDPVVAAIYAERGPALLTEIVQGRDILPVTHYQTAARALLQPPLIALLVTGLVLTVASMLDRDRAARIAGMSQGRAGLAITGLTAIVALAVFAAALYRVESSRLSFAPPHSSLSYGTIEIELSHPTGFYDDPIEVEIAATDVGRLYYTVDGSQPDPANNRAATRRVEGPIRISERTDQPNFYAAIETTVAERRTFTPPDFPVPKATVLRVRGEGTSEAFATYFVGGSVRPQTLPTLSLIAEPAYLFDHHIGIRVPGALTEAWRRSDSCDPSERWDLIPANYQMRGRDWERPLRETLDNPVVIQFCEANRECSFSQATGIRTHGGFSRTYSFDKSIRLYAREEYGAATFDHVFFDAETPAHARLILRNSGNDWNHLRFMDAFWQSLFPDDHVDTQAYLPLRLFLNGEYWGIYNLRERQDEYYVENIHGISRDFVKMLDNSTALSLQVFRKDAPADGSPRQSPFAPEVWEEWAEFIRSIDHAEPDVDTIMDEVNVESLFDYVAAHTFAGVNDWVNNNTRWWRAADSHTPASDVGTPTPWRFMLADFDSANNPDGLNAFTNGRITDLNPDNKLHRDGFPHLFMAIVKDPQLRDQFLNRYADLMNSALHPARTTRELDELVTLLEPEMELSRRRWSTGSMDEWFERIDDLRRFLEQRPEAMREELAEFFGLEGNADVEIMFTGDLDALRINTLDLLDAPP